MTRSEATMGTTSKVIPAVWRGSRCTVLNRAGNGTSRWRRARCTSPTCVKWWHWEMQKHNSIKLNTNLSKNKTKGKFAQPSESPGWRSQRWESECFPPEIINPHSCTQHHTEGNIWCNATSNRNFRATDPVFTGRWYEGWWRKSYRTKKLLDPKNLF